MSNDVLLMKISGVYLVVILCNNCRLFQILSDAKYVQDISDSLYCEISAKPVHFQVQVCSIMWHFLKIHTCSKNSYQISEWI
jgi:hypothetical protein